LLKLFSDINRSNITIRTRMERKKERESMDGKRAGTEGRREWER